MDEKQVTDLHVFGDWRPLHREAVLLAKVRGFRVWAYEEGYLRPDYITMEQGGVNGLSSLPDTREGIAELAARYPDIPEARKVGNPQTVKTWRAIAHLREPSFSGRCSGIFRRIDRRARSRATIKRLMTVLLFRLAPHRTQAVSEKKQPCVYQYN